MRSSKNRSRSKNNRNRSTGGNVVNRVFDSSGPEGKVRGTPQQIIDKYNQLAADATLGNDRVAAENFQQHAEHYLRLLSVAQKEMEEQREKQEREREERRERQEAERAERQRKREEAQAAVVGEGDQPDLVFVDAEKGEGEDGNGLVETPEQGAKPKRARKPRKPRGEKSNRPKDDAAAPAAEGASDGPQDASQSDAEPKGDAPEAAE